MNIKINKNYYIYNIVCYKTIKPAYSKMLTEAFISKLGWLGCHESLQVHIYTIQRRFRTRYLSSSLTVHY